MIDTEPATDDVQEPVNFLVRGGGSPDIANRSQGALNDVFVRNDAINGEDLDARLREVWGDLNDLGGAGNEPSRNIRE